MRLTAMHVQPESWRMYRNVWTGSNEFSHRNCYSLYGLCAASRHYGKRSHNFIGTDAFQEADITGITMPITKHSYLVRNVEDLPRIIHEAFHIANTGRKGPVLIDIPKDVSAEKTII